MAIDFDARARLQKALIAYMTGTTRSFEFDDQNSVFQRSSDKSVQQISQFLDSLLDDFIDHPISVDSVEWKSLLRVIAFLGTDLEASSTAEVQPWPFCDFEEWHRNEIRLNKFDLPIYDALIHYQMVNPWWNTKSGDPPIGIAGLLLLTSSDISPLVIMGRLDPMSDKSHLASASNYQRLN